MKETVSASVSRESFQAPYVVSADVHGLMKRWTQERGLALPPQGFFDEQTHNLHDTLSDSFPGGVEIVDERELRDGILARARRAESPILSLDRAYLTSKSPNVAGFIDVTRAVDEELNSIGLRERPGMPTKAAQIEALRASDVKPITLADDVIFTGEGAVEIAKELAAVNRPVERIIAGIGIAGGIELIEEQGIQVDVVKRYEDVVDEVCSRDFTPGMPMSGRTVYASDGSEYSAPYLYPFGKPEKWASIPSEHVVDFSRTRMEQAVEVWRETELASGVKIPTDQMPRQLYGVHDAQSIVYALQRYL